MVAESDQRPLVLAARSKPLIRVTVVGVEDIVNLTLDIDIDDKPFSGLFRVGFDARHSLANARKRLLGQADSLVDFQQDAVALAKGECVRSNLTGGVGLGAC